MTAWQRRRPTRGFSILELIIVVAITLVVAAIAIPGVLTAAQDYRLRGTASGFSGLVQRCRMLAVSRNAAYALTSGGSGLDVTNTVTGVADPNNVLPLPTGFAIDTTGGGLSTGTLNVPSGVSLVATALPRFNPRGLPCFVSSGVCKADATKMYVTYLRQDRSIGGNGWAAVTVTPAGRVQVFTWSGSKWQ